MKKTYLFLIFLLSIGLFSCSASYEEKVASSKGLALDEYCRNENSMYHRRQNQETRVYTTIKGEDLDCTNFSGQALEANSQMQQEKNTVKKIDLIKNDLKRVEENKKKRIGYLSKNIIILGDGKSKAKSCFYDVLGSQEVLSVCVKCSCPSQVEF